MTIAISDVVDLPWDEALATSRELGLEGLVLKRRTSTYQVGRRSRDWRKVKHVEHAGRTRSGSLRHPVWRGLRPDLG